MNDLHPNPYTPPAAAIQPIAEDENLVYQEASKGKRFLNFIIDRFAVVGFAAVVGFTLAILEEMNVVHGAMESMEDMSGLADIAFTVVLTLGYYVGTEFLFGRTLGKLITGTKVLSDAGAKPSFGAVLGRTCARVVPFEPFSFFGERGWHDSWSGTQVVDVRKPKVAVPRPSVARFYR